MTATVQVAEFNSLDEMILQICNTKTTNGDPNNENNWYRILKTRYDSRVLVQSRINGGSVSTKTYMNWAGATGSLTISISTGSIALYENGNLRYSEPFALPSYKCHVYVFTSTLRSRSSGTDRFDNFTVYPTATATTTAFKDDFMDGNYNGWTVDSGNWQASTKKLSSTAQNSHIHINTPFSTNRTVKTEIQTLSHTGDPWNVPWLFAKEQDGNNNVYALIHTNGNVELSMYYQGNKTILGIASSSLNPYSTHVLTVSIIGTNAKVWVDGTLYHNITNNNLANLAGYVGLYTPSSTGLFDNIIVFDE
jgi:hypothetical protein